MIKISKRSAIAVLAATLATIVIVYAVPTMWYYSLVKTTTVTEYIVTISDIPASVAKGETLHFTGRLTFAGDAVKNVPVTLFLEDIDTGVTATTDTGGYYALDYTVTETAGTILNFKVGYYG